MYTRDTIRKSSVIARLARAAMSVEALNYPICPDLVAYFLTHQSASQLDMLIHLPTASSSDLEAVLELWVRVGLLTEHCDLYGNTYVFERERYQRIVHAVKLFCQGTQAVEVSV